MGARLAPRGWLALGLEMLRSQNLRLLEDSVKDPAVTSHHIFEKVVLQRAREWAVANMARGMIWRRCGSRT